MSLAPTAIIVTKIGKLGKLINLYCVVKNPLASL